MLELVFHIVMLAAFAAFGAAQAVYYAHMLQLNSYRPERYARWCRQHPGRLFGAARLFFPLAAVVASVVLAALELSAGCCMPPRRYAPGWESRRFGRKKRKSRWW